MRRARARDANEREIVTALRAAGASVTRLDDPGVPDLLVGWQGRTLLLEVKRHLGPRGGKSQRREAEGGRGDLTRAQVVWFDAWRGAPAIVVRSVRDALAALADGGQR